MLYHHQLDSLFFEEQKSTLLGVYTNFIASRYKVYTKHTKERSFELSNRRDYVFTPSNPSHSRLRYKKQLLFMHPEDLAKLRDGDFSFLPDTIEIEDIFEVEAYENQAYKIVFRIPLPKTPNTHISCVIEGATLVTFWLNEDIDNHRTLNARKYTS